MGTIILNYRKNKVNIFFQGDYLYTQTLNKNEFVTRTYDNGTVINQQTKRNRNTHFATAKAGIDYNINDHNMLTVSGLYGSEHIIDNGDQPFYNSDFTERLRLWQFLEDELKTTVMASAAYQHKFKQLGHLLNAGFNYTYHSEDEKYFFDNILPTYTGKDAFKLIPIEQVADLDFIKYVRISDESLSASSENYPNRPKIPVTHMNHDTAIGIQILYSTDYKTIDFFDINSPVKGNGSKMVDAILKDFPKDWQPAVVMDWSDGFWDKMEEKYKNFEWIM